MSTDNATKSIHSNAAAADHSLSEGCRVEVERLQALLDTHAEVNILQALRDLQIQFESFRIINTESGLKIVQRNDRAFDARALTEARSLTGALRAHLSRFRCWQERLYCHWRRLKTRMIVSGIAGRGHFTPGLMLIAMLDRVVRYLHRPSQVYELSLRTLATVLLPEPEHNISRIFRAREMHMLRIYCRRYRHLNAPTESHQLADHFSWPGEADYQRWAGSDQRSRVLLTIHMGDYLGALARIGRHAPPGRGVSTLRREDIDGSVSDLYGDDTRAHKVFYHGVDSTIEIMSALRGGNHTLNAFFDLGADAGETVAVSFLGRPAHFVRGPVLLAVTGRALIVPFVTFFADGNDQIKIFPATTPSIMQDESLDQAVQRITQQLVSLAEQWILAFPEQWRYLKSLPAYFVMAAGATSNSASKNDEKTVP